MSEVRNAAVMAFLLGTLMAAGVLLFKPGTSGSFYFDDYANINQLQVFDAQGFNKTAFLNYIQNAPAGPFKRPIATLSFLLDDWTWPAIPTSFKWTNIKLHVLTGILLFWLLWKIGSSLRPEPPIWVAWIGAAVWMLHPYQVSTVLYCVQRMAILAGMFTIAALIAYCYGFEYIKRRQLLRGYLLLVFVVNLLILCSVLSKETGMLAFWLILVVDQFILRTSLCVGPETGWRWYKTIFLWLPSVILGLGILYQAYLLVLNGGQYPNRGFDAIERTLTEPRIICQYLYDLLIPKYETLGLLAENYPPSKGLLSPPTTLLSIVSLIAIFVAAIKSRKKYPVVAGAIIFYFVGHALESTFFNLELYFEHRNYLPSILIFYAFAYEIWRHKGSKIVKGYLRYIAAFWVMVALLLLYERAVLWGNDPALVAVWAEKNPSSSRAQLYASQVMFEKGYIQQGRLYIERAIKAEPDNPVPILHAAIFNCRSSAKIELPERRKTNEILSKYPFSLTTFLVFRKLVEVIHQTKCNSWSDEDINSAADSYFTIRKGVNDNQYALGLWLKGYNAILGKETSTAARFFYQAASASGDVVLGLGESAMLASQGDYKAALRQLDLIEQKNQEKNSDDSPLITAKYQWIESEIARLREVYLKEAKVTWQYGE